VVERVRTGLAIESGEERAWFWIGSHADYDKLVGQKPAKRMQPTRARRPAKNPKNTDAVDARKIQKHAKVTKQD